MKNNKTNLAMYILVNKNIEISSGKLAGQVGHAVARYIYRNVYSPKIAEYMENSREKKIVLSCSEKDLLKYESEGHTSVRDSGLTELEPDTLTCVCLGVLDKDAITDKKLKRMRLYK